MSELHADKRQVFRCRGFFKIFCASYIANAKREGPNHLFPLKPIYIAVIYVCIFMSCVFHM